jgi:ATP-dependent Clp protease ATP-binding subunit ClpX
MEIPLHIKRSIPFMTLGQDIANYHHRKHPDPFESNNITEEPDVILKRIETATAALQKSIANDKSDQSMADFHKVIGIAHGKFPPADFTHILSLSIFYDFASLRAEQTPDNIAYRLGSVMDSENILQGRLLARHALGLYIERGLFVLDGDYIHPNRNLVTWFTNGNPLLNCGLNQETVSKVKASKRKSSGASTSNSTAVAFVNALPHLTPEQMNSHLTNEGYTGQETARHVLCLSAYRHVQRLRKLYVDKIDPQALPKRENILCIGSTGCGKTYLVTLLFDKILKLPSVIVDITKFSETGYVGDEVETILTRLLNKANGDVSIAQTGIACIDEIDKVAGTARSLSPFGGERTTKDVSGYGVQRGLLKLLEGSVVDAPVQLGDYRSNRIPFNTGNVLFIGCGAFSGLERIGKRHSEIGFSPKGKAESDKHHNSFTDNLCAYGLMPEFYGRFEQFTFFNKLPRAELRHILEVNTIGSYRRELSLEGIDLQIEDTAIDFLIDAAMERGTGARGLPAGLIGVLTEAMYQVYSVSGGNESRRKIRIYASERNGSGIQWEIQTKPTKPISRIKEVITRQMDKPPMLINQSAGDA